MTHPALEEYQIGIICALNIELAAVRAALDEEYGRIESPDIHDSGTYFGGRIHNHNVVIACLPAGVDGTIAATATGLHMLRTFEQLRFGLLVGIGGGIPDIKAGVDVRLGDIVVSQPQGTFSGVVQYDNGKSKTDDRFEGKGHLNAPPKVLLTALQALQAEHLLEESRVCQYLDEMLEKRPRMRVTGFTAPAADKDVLFSASYPHALNRTTCDACDQSWKVPRIARSSNAPEIHYGIIASGNRVIKDAEARDRLREEYQAICVEMEAAGLMNDLPCLVIRGICDYADSHKNDDWHKYAAITAAAFTKELLCYISPTQTGQEKPIRELLHALQEHKQETREHLESVRNHYLRAETESENKRHYKCHRAFKTSAYAELKDLNPDRVPGTCLWVLNNQQYQRWYGNTSNDLLWISADPGCGKSVLSRSLIDQDLRVTSAGFFTTVCYFFFKDNEQQDRLSIALCAILHQLFTQKPLLIEHAMQSWTVNGEKMSYEVDDLWRIFLNATSDPRAGNVICVLDALDECRDTDRYRIIRMLCQFYKDSVGSKTGQASLKFLVTSRPYFDILDGFQDITQTLPTIRLRGEDKNDELRTEIDRVVRKTVADLARDLCLAPATKDALEEKLLKMEHRTYLWLHLAAGCIRQSYRQSLRPDQATFEFLPATIDEAYEQLLRRVDEEQRCTVKLILGIVVGARQALTLEEMAIALQIATAAQPLRSVSELSVDRDHFERSIRQWCGLFVYIDHSRIYLLHQTAKEFLLSQDDIANTNGNWRHCLSLVETQRTMAWVCVDYLLLQDVQQYCNTIGNPPGQFSGRRWWHNLSEEPYETAGCMSFACYSITNWASHLRDSRIQNSDLLLAKVLQLYKKSSQVLRSMVATFAKSSTDHQTPLLDSVNWAAYNGHTSILEELLRIRKHDTDILYERMLAPLVWASAGGHEKMVQYLLESGVDVNARDEYRCDALSRASEWGHQNVVQLLLDNGAKTSGRDSRGHTALTKASRWGHESIARLLLDTGADVNVRCCFGRTALIVASTEGHQSVVQVLLDNGAEINVCDTDGNTALIGASLRGHDGTVQLLLDSGAAIDARSGKSALVQASLHGQASIVRLLLDHDVNINVNTQDLFGDTALDVALTRGYQSIVQMLLDHNEKGKVPTT